MGTFEPFRCHRVLSHWASWWVVSAFLARTGSYDGEGRVRRAQLLSVCVIASVLTFMAWGVRATMNPSKHPLPIHCSRMPGGVQSCAQVLLTLDNLANRAQYINASNTFTELFACGAIPIVNENDTVAVEGLRIGDNDTLSAQVQLEVLHCRTSM